MKVIIPMAGRGTRLRPQTNTIPKPLLKLCGKSMIEWIVEELKYASDDEIEEIHFIIGDFGKENENLLVETAKKVGSKGFIHYQREALGTAHALYCAKEALNGNVFVAFADTIFKGKIEIDKTADGIIWTMQVDDPSRYGVVITNSDGVITDFIEKPKSLISNLAIVGLYYFNDASLLRKEIIDLVENNKKENNEFQLTNCLESLKKNKLTLKNQNLLEWLDCGNRTELLKTNKRLIEISGLKNNYINSSVTSENSTIKNCSIEENCSAVNCDIENSIVYENSELINCKLKNSIIGKNCVLRNVSGTVYLGDFTEIINEE